MSHPQETAQDLHVFISYRRSDCQPQANGLNDGLRSRLPGARVFMDIDSIPLGVDFEQHIRQEIQGCDVVLVLIGDDWLEPVDASGRRRLDEPNDFVRLEVENALAADSVRLVPVLVEGASMPPADELPASIRRLARLQAFRLSDHRWANDVDELARQVSLLVSTPQVPAAPSSVRLDQIDREAVRTAVSLLGEEFQTKDVSEHPQAQAAHGVLTGARNYHSMVGQFISRNCVELGVASAGRSNNGRGELWRTNRPRTASRQRPEPEPSRTVPPARPMAGQAPAPTWGASVPAQAPAGAADTSRGPNVVGSLMVALPLVTLGFASWVPPLWAATKRDDAPRTRRALYVTAVVLAVGVLVGFVLLGSGPSDDDGTPQGAASDIGLAMILAGMFAGVAVAFVQRGAGRDAARRQRTRHSFEPAMAARAARQHYRRLAAEDPGLARESGLGRPDLSRPYDDGGLLDLNSLSAQSLAGHAPLSPAQARAVVELRERFGRLSSVDELVVHTELGEAEVAHLREHAVFL